MSVGSLAGNLFLNFTLSTLADLPSGILLGALADKVGCKRILTVSAVGMGIACCSLAFLPDKEYPTAVLALYLIGKVFASLSLNACWAYTSELYPTNLRYMGHMILGSLITYPELDNVVLMGPISIVANFNIQMCFKDPYI